MKKYDLIVVGGGFSGFAAALSAARQNLSVLILEQTNCLGGSAAGCLVNPFMPHSTKINGERFVLCRGIFEEVKKELEEFNEIKDDSCFNEEYLKLIMNRMALDAGVELLFHAFLCGVKTEGKKIVSVTAATKSGNLELFADYFIDASGDADLTVMAGFPYRLGRENDNLCQPMTLCFRVSGVNMEKFREERENFTPLYKKFKEEGKIKNVREDVLIFHTLLDGVLHFNSTRIVKLNPTDVFDVTKAEIEAREQVFELFFFLRDNFETFKNSNISSTAAFIGVRESRMIDGEYILTGKDLVDCVKFEDSIAVGNYDIDIHNPEGSGTSHYFFPQGQYYTIPYRALIPKDSENLLTVGRCISVDHEAQASIRIMPIVCCIGEAAGVGVSVAKKSGCSVRQTDVSTIQAILKDTGAVL